MILSSEVTHESHESYHAVLNVKGTMRGANPMNPTTTITAKRIGECTT